MRANFGFGTLAGTSPPRLGSDGETPSEVSAGQVIEHERVDLDAGPACDGVQILSAEGDLALGDQACQFPSQHEGLKAGRNQVQVNGVGYHLDAIDQFLAHFAPKFERQLVSRTEEHLIAERTAESAVCIAWNRRTGQTRSQ